MIRRIVILGGGFAGLSALKTLRALKDPHETILVDKKETSDFLPLIPDVVGRQILPETITYSLPDIASQYDALFIRDEVMAIDLAEKILRMKTQTISYDYLLIATGSESNFYGQAQLAQNSFILDSVEDVKKILHALSSPETEAFIVAGGGYTGIEIATNIWRFMKKRGLIRKILIVEKSSSILGPLPDWMKKHTIKNLERMGIKVFTDTMIRSAKDGQVVLTDGQVIERAALVWTAGVKTAACVSSLAHEQCPQGRLVVDSYLRIRENVFVAGDAACVRFNNEMLRMSIQFALMQGKTSAWNMIQTIKNGKLKEFHPFDLGYIIPLANDSSCGKVLGINVRGRSATFFHFFMCVFRLRTWRKKKNILKRLLFDQ